MSTFETIIFALFIGFFTWLLIRYIRENPFMLTRENFTKTARTLGFLTLLLMGVMWFCVLLLN